MSTVSYQTRREQLRTYFDHTAMDAWSQLTSDAPLSRIRATVREGRNQMRNALLSWLPEDLRGATVLDAGCGTGAMAVELAHRGAQVLAIDLSPALIELARSRAPRDLGRGSIEFRAGDMLEHLDCHFDHVVAMDSLIHYDSRDMAKALKALSENCSRSMLFTFVPRTLPLAAMHAIGRVFPHHHRAPEVVPIAPNNIRRQIRAHGELDPWCFGDSARISKGFYTSQGLQLVRG